MTAFEIFVIVALKGALVVILAKFGFWPDWEKLDREKREEKLLLRAYKQWRKDAGPEAAAKLSVALHDFTDSAGNRRPVQNRTR